MAEALPDMIVTFAFEVLCGRVISTALELNATPPVEADETMLKSG